MDPGLAVNVPAYSVKGGPDLLGVGVFVGVEVFVGVILIVGVDVAAILLDTVTVGVWLIVGVDVLVTVIDGVTVGSIQCIVASTEYLSP